MQNSPLVFLESCAGAPEAKKNRVQNSWTVYQEPRPRLWTARNSLMKRGLPGDLLGLIRGQVPSEGLIHASEKTKRPS